MANPIIASVNDARSHFAHHSYISSLITAYDNAQTPSEQEQAMVKLAEAISGALPSADVSQLLESANTLLLESNLQQELSDS